MIENIREGASLLFRGFGLHDFARIDGWFFPSSVTMTTPDETKFGRTEFGTIVFTDINLVTDVSFLCTILLLVIFCYTPYINIHGACLDKWNGADKLLVSASFKGNLTIPRFVFLVY